MSNDEVKATTERETVMLYVISVSFDDKVKEWSLPYVKYDKLLKFKETNEITAPLAPFGLKQIRPSELPKMGGILGHVAIAETPEQARDLLFRTLTSEVVKATKHLEEATRKKQALEALINSQS